MWAAMETLVGVCALLTVSVHLATAGKPLRVYEFCLWMCDHWFDICIREDECPGGTWPLSASKCAKKLSECIDRCRPFEHLRV
ncbi:hypothetical protein LSAT2_032229 [Lamellibrachia satsuma]|nr:hypothetical protein LSAT2_032229 [Lamellibrachia satsuma]